MTMMGDAYEFAEPVDAARLEQLLRLQLGSRIGRLEELRIEGRKVSALSMDAVSLMYLAKCCQELGGAPEGGRRIAIPAWAQTPWPAYSWWQRLRIVWRRGALDFKSI